MILDKVKNCRYFGVIVDEARDVSTSEQVSFNVRCVSKHLVVQEYFLGYYKSSNTSAEVLCEIILDVLYRFDLEVSNMRGQCYDGAANMSGHISGVQRRIREVAPKAFFVHCLGHNLNLVVQDGMEKIDIERLFINSAREFVNLVRNSPKRLDFFKQIQSESDEESLPQLSIFCPTR